MTTVTKLRITFVVFAALLVSLSASSQTTSQQNNDNPRVVDWSGGYFGEFHLIYDPNHNFTDIDYVAVDYVGNQENDERELAPDSRGHIPTIGKLMTKTGVRLPFSQSLLTEGGREIKINWTTNAVNGVHYSFEGTYCERTREIKENQLIVGYVDIEGTLTKFVNGRAVTRGEIGLERFGME